MATTVTCQATTCKHNSSDYCNSDKGYCKLSSVNFVLDEDDNYFCEEFTWDTVKPYMSNTELKVYRGK